VDGPAEPVEVGSSTSWEAAFSARGPEADQTVRFSWGDGSETTMAPTTAGIAHAEHVYDEAGVYTVEVEVTDGQGVASRVFSFRYAVVYDPAGGSGFVTGGGWIHSPPGAFHPGLAEMAGVEGRASFGFVSRYKKGASVPTGDTEFEFRAGNLDFASTEYQWLVVGGKRAQYKGWGRINGSPDLYGFMLTCNDGRASETGDEPDRFRIKIWEEASETVIYDNQHGDTDNSELNDATVLGGGSIVIHKPDPGGKDP
jgi:hypothetical protein